MLRAPKGGSRICSTRPRDRCSTGTTSHPSSFHVLLTVTVLRLTTRPLSDNCTCCTPRGIAGIINVSPVGPSKIGGTHIVLYCGGRTSLTNRARSPLTSNILYASRAFTHNRPSGSNVSWQICEALYSPGPLPRRPTENRNRPSGPYVCTACAPESPTKIRPWSSVTMASMFSKRYGHSSSNSPIVNSTCPVNTGTCAYATSDESTRPVTTLTIGKSHNRMTMVRLRT